MTNTDDFEHGLAQFDVFISHAGQDKDKYIYPLVESLELRGISYWLDEKNLTIGDSLFNGINEGLRNSHYVLLCLSEAFLGRHWPESELGAALAIQNRLGQKRVLPVILNANKKVFKHYPLLADKLYVSWNNPHQVVDILFKLLTGPEDILQRTSLEIDAEVSDHLVLLSKKGNRALAVEDYLVQALADCPDSTQRYWIYYTLGRVGGSRVYALLEKAMRTEHGFALKGVKAGKRFFLKSSYF